jgi:uncharacterized SAM-binding protein YcdF (DUF218 family)
MWFMSFAYFISLIPAENAAFKLQDHKDADAIVIFTGDSNRIIGGLELSRAANIKYILISGVALHSSLEQIIHHYQNKRAYLGSLQIELGRSATNTVGNIQETAAWVEKNHFNSIVLVTSNYHMPRSEFLLNKKLQIKKLYVYPTFSDTFIKQSWWKSWKSIKLIFTEYNKYIACNIAFFFSDH